MGQEGQLAVSSSVSWLGQLGQPVAAPCFLSFSMLAQTCSHDDSWGAREVPCNIQELLGIGSSLAHHYSTHSIGQASYKTSSHSINGERYSVFLIGSTNLYEKS